MRRILVLEEAAEDIEQAGSFCWKEETPEFP
jgi:hypothetical protein